MSRAIRLLLVGGLLSAPASTQADVFRYLAFGDSITFGTGDPAENGYPPRLENLLGCTANTCVVVKHGEPGERTGQGISRLQDLLDNQSWDVVLLMEGTNDIFHDFSNNTIEFNLATMVANAEAAGVDTVMASIIWFHPDGTHGTTKDDEVEDLRNRIMNQTIATNHYFSDPWSRLCPEGSGQQACFNNHYADPPGAVGHPDASGYDLLADEMRDAIVELPVPGPPSPIEPIGTIGDPTPLFSWNKEIPRDANWYQLVIENATTTFFDQWLFEPDFCVDWQCTYDPGLNLPDGDYTWEVRGRNPLGFSTWVTTDFTVDAIPPPQLPTPVSPSGLIGEQDPTFIWTREAPTTAETYGIQIFDDGGFVIWDKEYEASEICDATSCSLYIFLIVPPLDPGDYTWRLRGINEGGIGDWTETLAFTVEPSYVFSDGFESGDTSAWTATTIE